MERSTFEAVVLDLCLPDGLGGAVLQQLQGVLPGGHPVWVVMSALDEDEAIRRFGPLQGPFLAKPFDPHELVDTLTGLLSDASSHPGRTKAESGPPGGAGPNEGVGVRAPGRSAIRPSACVGGGAD